MVDNDPQRTFYEDTYRFELDGITFTIRCSIDAFGAHYFPDAWNSAGERASGRMLPFRNTFNDLNFVRPPGWLVQAIKPDYSMFTEKQKATRREPERPPEFHAQNCSMFCVYHQ